MTEEQAERILRLCALAQRAREDGDRRLMEWAHDAIADVAAGVHRARWATEPGAA